MIKEYVDVTDNAKVLTFHNDGEGKFDGIGKARQLLLEEARRLDCDYSVFLNVDLEPNSVDFLDKMSIWKRDIVGSAYTEMSSPNPALVPEKELILALFYDGLGQTYFTDKLTDWINPCYCVSFGCVCLSRRIVQDKRLNFFPLVSDMSEDYSYCHKAFYMGYHPYVETTANLKHYHDLSIPRSWYSTTPPPL